MTEKQPCGTRYACENGKCECTPDETTGWTQVLACNICGKDTKETPNDFIAAAVKRRDEQIIEALEQRAVEYQTKAESLYKVDMTEQDSIGYAMYVDRMDEINKTINLIKKLDK